MKRVLTIFSILTIFLFILSAFGWMVKQIVLKKKEFGILTQPIKHMYNFPDLIKKSMKEVNELPKTFIPTPEDFQAINKLKQDVFVFFSFSINNEKRGIVLKNLRTGSTIRKWEVENKHGKTARIIHPMLLKDGSLIYGYDFQWHGIKRIDLKGKKIWHQAKPVYHHAKEFNKEGNIWACTVTNKGLSTGTYKIYDRKIYYFDMSITKVDVETGKILFYKSVTELLKDNKLSSYILKSPAQKDPLHLNDVQPALKTTDYYKEDDVFLSFRNISAIIHYRPSSNKVIRIIEGPFVSQHDVDFLNDHTLTIFNNNYYEKGVGDTKEPPEDSSYVINSGHFYSNIVTYDFRDGSFSTIGDSIFKANKILTRSEGLVEFIDEETYFVEEQNTGIIWVIKNNEVIYKNVFKSQHEGYHHLPNWTRVIKDIDEYEIRH
jgi:hypothetical protein